MTQQDYRDAMDAVTFTADFQERTMARLEALNREKECIPMKQPMRTGLIAACLVATVAVSASAAVLWLTPKDVAEHIQNPALAAALESDSAVNIQQTETIGDYHVTLLGLVSGKGLDAISLEDEKTYAVLACTRADGAAITDNVPEITISPLVSGYMPWQVNAWTLGGGATTFAENGVLYYVFNCETLEPFADHTVFMAAYLGTHRPPSAELFSFAEDGTIAFQSGQEGYLFTLPLDPSQADPAKAQAILDEAWGNDDDDPPKEATEGEENGEEDVITGSETEDDVSWYQSIPVLSPAE